MATDATGSPTPLGIPKYNTSADAPSGLGFNAAMDSIDALIGGRMTAPTTPSTGDVPVWNGSSWVKSSSAQKVAVSGLAPGSNAQVLGTSSGAPTWVGGMQLIQDFTLVAAGAVTFSSIPATFKHLKIIGHVMNNAASDATVNVNANGDNGANYQFNDNQGQGATFAGGSNGGATAMIAGWATSNANGFSVFEMTIPRYTSANFKQAVSMYNRRSAVLASGVVGSSWTGTPAVINQLVFTASGSSFAIGTEISLYGIS